ncbi:NrfD/PsrC family molybdoenzyme membrane anchor subunit [Desulfofustis glycolicus]|uniref:Prokaryotic molybdopterin-containing oxidoreductase family, membrane subunit n=1 Tax=Desulfofustis glycolicus DSM 9705 TaxID=1121409 RepID=A0A1M5TH07_9BACT|nr:NrfD/PsrC family molybdoenzyme membrane anchor subunit [Desulfofustis glycolicus]MCB2216401.1 polysulfide reductase NrfD [Desulfobulbaceae bacterium]SHH49941.1 prokaryotic molybdopterin-containing oxidoreductase family, membrane subunit [Desulfofustis glycolicus DSM 9705]
MSTPMKVALWISGSLFLVACAAWIYQLREGLILTNLQNSYSWGLYISGLAFFVGNAAGGLVLTSSIYLFGVKKLKPLAKLGALTAFANVTAAMLIVLPDIGKPFRLYQMLLHPNLMSPLIWDVVVLNLYALASALYLYILLLPDLTGRLARFAIPVDDPHAFSEKWAKRIAPPALLFAIGIHVVTAWIFSTQGGRDWWHSPAMAPDFVSVAIAVGTTVVLLAGVLAYGTGERYQDAYRTLGLVIFIATCIHLFLMMNDLVIHAWYGGAETTSIMAVAWGDFAWAHILEVVAPLLGAVLLLREGVRRSLAAVSLASALIIGGVFIHRFLLMPAAYNVVPMSLSPLGLPGHHWSLPIASGRFFPDLSTFVEHYSYAPSLVEIVILLGIVAYAVFLVLLAVSRLPILQREGT